MNKKTVYICGTGIISPLGNGLAATEQTLRQNKSAIRPLKLFSLLRGVVLPVGEVRGPAEPSSLPRTHLLAQIAAEQALASCPTPPDAIVLGTTTGGILTTERLLRNKELEKEQYSYHGLQTVADFVAQKCHCSGPAIVVSTACSSGAVAIAIALRMLRSGMVKTVLAGAADSLSHLTYFGFHSLQLVDRIGCKPLDQNRRGMAVAEGAAMLLLSTEKFTDDCCAELLGAGLSCDAYHPATPHPEGRGAFTAMANSLADAGLQPKDIDYINLHGTGTVENDLAEAKAVRKLFSSCPPLSSIKGASGHSLAAAGAIEAVISTMAVCHGLMPANTGLQQLDPALSLCPLRTPLERPVKAVLSNSFGFGGNNGSLVIGALGSSNQTPMLKPPGVLAIHGLSCLSGGGDLPKTLARLRRGESISGPVDLKSSTKELPPRLIRRLKRLPRMSLALAQKAYDTATITREAVKPAAVFMGTSWGALSETYDFLTRLNESKEEFPSPTDFVGSVHNGPASQIALLFGATGANITTSGGDYSFEQAVFSAGLLLDEASGPALLLGADEGHEFFSPLLDQSISACSPLAEGGAAFYIDKNHQGAGCCISLRFYRSSRSEGIIEALGQSLTSPENPDAYALILAGIPGANRQEGEKQLQDFLALSKLSCPVVDYRKIVGEFASATAIGTALAANFLDSANIPGQLTGGSDILLTGGDKKILLLGLGRYITAMEILKP